MPGLNPFVGRTRQEARNKYELLSQLVDPLLGLSYLYGQMGDLSGYPLDGPVPEPADAQVRSIAKNLLTLARRDNLTIRQLYTHIAAGFGTRVVIGTLPVSLDDFVELVLPELRQHGMFRNEYEGVTLRQNLGLEMPKSRYVVESVRAPGERDLDYEPR